MDQLEASMQEDSGDFESRLGRKKPDVEIEIGPVEESEEEMEVPEEGMDMEAESESPDSSLKSRLMKLRGK